MNRFPKFAVAVATLLVSSSFALADTIQLGSYATGAASIGDANTAVNYAGFNAVSTTPTSGTASTFTLATGGVWAGPLTNSTWVGLASNAGPVGTSNPAFGYYTFTTNFTALSSSLYSGTLGILADDTAEVLLNGSVLIPFGTLGASGTPGFLATDNVSLSGLSLLSVTNANTLTFVVRQAGSGPTGGTLDPSGVDFDATLSTSTSVPESSTFILMAIGLVAVGGGTFGRRALAFASARSAARR